jgi:hypothetical protein
VSHLAWCPVFWDETGRLGDLAERAPYVVRVERGTDCRGEHEVVVLPRGTGAFPGFFLARAVGVQCGDASYGVPEVGLCL